ncbi:RbsD or FucU transport [Syntrophobotulus glycolicus DSM 8271]|uniref:RbsD or FucU transport n=1 Tax=Syntrophobotulus glycolicus (strain DSM 8271 / FlGlyR) TaxID=645991 RepID=F0SXR5_SYNGF|nr:RbsD/FucU domain-containing protein [Syntrophobotulus glycolicus]ADY55898.1 RbsD or FucU transport [Syntrophobotulus glycolicus DSM 8271]
MLRGISPLISPELLKILCEMGHGDDILIADANFPAASMGRIVLQCPGIDACSLLAAILKLFPLDHLVDAPMRLMAVEEGDQYLGIPEIWNRFQKVAETYQYGVKMLQIERQEFYRQSRQAYAIIQTGEKALYGNLLLKKGVIRE